MKKSKDEPVVLTHFDTNGQAHMVDISSKADTGRVAIGRGSIHMQPRTLEHVKSGTADKGDVLGIARIAGIMAAKRTSELIPLCHPLALTHLTVDFDIDDDASSIHCFARAETHGRTGVEMEALAAVQIALLTVYDMLKAIDRGMTITNVCLLEKSGGRSGHWLRNE